MKNIFTLLIFASALLMDVSFSDNSIKNIGHVFLLDQYDQYMKYEKPEKGEANAKILLEEDIMIMQIVTPVYNIHGIETAPSLRSEEEKNKVEEAKNKFLRAPQDFFKFKPADSCTLDSLIYALNQVETGHEQTKPQVTKWHHYDVKVEFYYSCKEVLPETLNMQIFKGYPSIKKIHTQFVANNSDLRRTILIPEKPVIQFTRTSGVDIK